MASFFSMPIGSIKRKIALVIFLFLTLLLILVGGSSLLYFKQAIRSLLAIQQVNMVAVMARGMDEKILITQNALLQFTKTLTGDIFDDKKKAKEKLEADSYLHTLFTHGVALINKEGELIAFSGTELHPAAHDFFHHALVETIAANGPLIFSPQQCPWTLQPIVLMSNPLRDRDGQVTGVVIGAIALLEKKGIFADLIQMKIGETGYPYLFGRDRMIILHPDASRIMKKDVPVGSNILFDRAVAGFEGAGETVNSRGLHTLVAFKRMQSTDWILAINYPVDEAFAPLCSYLAYFLVGMLVFLLGSIILAVVISSRLTRPLLQITAQAKEITQMIQQGQFNQDLSVSSGYGGEVDTLATAFNTLLAQLGRRLSEFEDNLQVVFDNTDKGIIIHDLQGHILCVNRPAQVLFDADQANLCSLTVLDLSAESSAKHKELPQTMQRVMAGEIFTLSWHCRRVSDGRPFEAEIYYTRIVWNKEPVLMGMVEDVTEKHEKNSLLYRLSTAVEQSANTIVITDKNGTIEYANPSIERMTGYSVAEAIGNTPRILKSGVHSHEFYRQLWHTITEGNVWRGEFCNRHKDGHKIWESTVITPILEDQQITHFVAIKEDITLRKEQEEHLYYQANFDELTGLPNRNLLARNFSERIANGHYKDGKPVLILMDLDDFKNINDSLGHSVGDNLLQAVAGRLRDGLQSEDMIARMGGDEFAFTPLRITRDEQIDQMVALLLQSFIEPFVLHGQEIFVTASIGIAVFPEDGRSLEELLRNADSAMYASKRKGRNAVARYNRTLNENLQEKLQMMTLLRRALERNEFQVYYQAQQELLTEKIASFEALLRWQPQEGPLISPIVFIPLLEETGMIVAVGEWVLREVCCQVYNWQRTGLHIEHASVNVSFRQFQRPDFVERVLVIVKESGVNPSAICLELTESIMMENMEENLSKIHKLHAAGISISIDDFGTGYSSLSYLRQMNIQELKIDQSFIKSLTENTVLVNAILNLARSLGLRVVAEGVETEEQLHFLKAHQCECIQGYLVSRPVPALQFAALVRSYQAG